MLYSSPKDSIRRLLIGTSIVGSWTWSRRHFRGASPRDRRRLTKPLERMNACADRGRARDRLKRAALVTVLSGACLLASCGHPSQPPRPRERSVLAPDAVDALPLVSVDAFPKDQQDILRAVAAELLRTGQQPTEFYVTVRKSSEGAKVDLWHQTAFLPENRELEGNPGGRCFTMYLDRDGRVSKKLKWQ